MRGMSSLKVYRGGLVGSGKLVLLKGSVSSRSCTLQTKVAMAYPCNAASEGEDGGCDADRQQHRRLLCSSSSTTPRPLLSRDLLHSRRSQRSARRRRGGDPRGASGEMRSVGAERTRAGRRSPRRSADVLQHLPPWSAGEMGSLLRRELRQESLRSDLCCTGTRPLV